MDTKSSIKVSVEGTSLTLLEKKELEQELTKKLNEIRKRDYSKNENKKIINFPNMGIKDKIKKIDLSDVTKTVTALAGIIAASSVAIKTGLSVSQESRLRKRERRLQKEAKRKETRA